MTEKICLIIPPSSFLTDEKVFVSLGILKVAACLESANISVSVLDCSGKLDYIDYVVSNLDSYNIVGITATTSQLPSAVFIARTIREKNPNIKIILGGPHVTVTAAAKKLEKISGRASRAWLSLENEFDVLVSGDGEIAIFEAIKTNAPKFIDGDSLPLLMSKDDYEKSPWPARYLIDIDSYHYSIEGYKATNLIAQLGCPFGCNFCSGRSSKSLRSIRTRSVNNIINEIEYLYKTYGFVGFNFFDDELNVNPKLVDLMNGIVNLQSKLGVEFRLRGFVKSELFNDEQAAVMYKAGFRWILCGFESGSERILTNINKKATVADNDRVIQIARRHGLKVKALMSIGHAGETEETIKETKEWLIKNIPEDFDCTIITPYPGSPYYDNAVEMSPGVFTFTAKNGDKLHCIDIDYTQTSDYYKGNPGEYKSFVFTDALSPEKLVKLRDELEFDVRKILKEIPNQVSNIFFESSMGQSKHLPIIG